MEKNTRVEKFKPMNTPVSGSSAAKINANQALTNAPDPDITDEYQQDNYRYKMNHLNSTYQRRLKEFQGIVPPDLSIFSGSSPSPSDAEKFAMEKFNLEHDNSYKLHFVPLLNLSPNSKLLNKINGINSTYQRRLGEFQGVVPPDLSIFSGSSPSPSDAEKFAMEKFNLERDNLLERNQPYKNQFDKTQMRIK